MAAVLTYWDGHGNAEHIRLMMAACGQEWEDKVALDPSGATHLSTKAQADDIISAGMLAFDQLPLLQIDGLNIVQKMAAVRYLARKYGLYGNDNAEATQIDILSESIIDFGGGAKEEKNQDKYMPRLERCLRGGSGGFLVGGSLSFVDVTLFKVIDDVVATNGDGFLGKYPAIAGHYQMMQANERIAAYLASDKRFPRPGRDGYMERVKATIPHLFAGEVYPMTSEVWNYRS